MDGWLDEEWMDGWLDEEWMDGWMDGWVDEKLSALFYSKGSIDPHNSADSPTSMFTITHSLETLTYPYNHKFLHT